MAEDDEAGHEARPRPRREGPLPVGGSLLIWAVMAVLAWGVVALVIHFL